MIRRLHHSAYRCRDVEETRRFYEDFLGLPMVNAFAITETKSGRATEAFHLFFALGDGSNLAFFDVPGTPFDFKEQHDYDLHIAVEVDREHLEPMIAKARAAGIDVRGIADHEIFESIYLRDPNGYVIELTANKATYRDGMDPAKNGARAAFAKWRSSYSK